MKIVKKLLLTLVVCAMTLTVVGVPGVNAADARDDNTQATAQVINFDGTFTDSLDGNDKNDYYQYTTTKDEVVAIAVMLDNPSYFSNGVWIDFTNSKGQKTSLYSNKWEQDESGLYITLVEMTAGTNYLNIFQYSSSTSVRYVMAFTKFTPQNQKITNVKGSYTLTYKNPKYTLAYLNPKSDAGYVKYSYKSSNTKVLTVDKYGYLKSKAYGKVTVTITAAKPTDYLGDLMFKTTTKKVTITVKPQAMKNAVIANYKKVKKKKKTVKQIIRKQLKVTWTRDKLATGYQVQIAKDKKFKKGLKSYTSKSNKTVSKTFTKLKKGSKYYMRARAYKTINGKKVYGPWVVTGGALKVL